MSTLISIFVVTILVSSMFGARYMIGVMVKKIKIGKLKGNKSSGCCNH